MSFKNDYLLRQVAGPQSKSCAVCYKPTPNVLITTDNLDFFYVCLSHLKDDGFATPAANPDYDALVKEERDLEALMKDLEIKISQSKPSIFNSIPGFRADTNSGAKEGDKDDKKGVNVYDTLVKEREVHQKRLTTVQQQIRDFRFKNYQLNGEMFKVRLRAYINKKANEKRLKEMAEPSFFPKAPNNALP